MKSIMLTDVREKVKEKTKVREEWSAIEARYLKQRTWRKVATAVAKGMRDHNADFNKSILESIPASWVVRVDGRVAVQEDAEEEEKEGQEDAVCMCCFDGSSLEGNRIMFCDGCNAAVHQACYGVQDIPEGDFFCDRCRAVQMMADEELDDDEAESYFDPNNARDAIKCCFCPMYHGGLKPTTDGRWVHLCCAIWSGNSSILDLAEMSPVDVSAVPVQVYREKECYDDRRRGRSGEKADVLTVYNDIHNDGLGQSTGNVNRRRSSLSEGISESDVVKAGCEVNHTNNVKRVRVGEEEGEGVDEDDVTNERCMFCDAYGGFVVRCSGCDTHTDTDIGVDSGSVPSSSSSSSSRKGMCACVFHPLCAWFQGVHIQTGITDPTFQVHDL